MKKKILVILLIIFLLALNAGCSSYQILFGKLDDLGFHDYYAVMPSGELNMKLKEKGYDLLDEYKSKKLYINPKVKDKYIVTRFQATNYQGYERVGWRIVAVDEQIPDEWEGKKEY